MFLVKCLKDEEDNMNIHEFITISTAPTRAGSSGLSLNANLTHTLRAKHFYFNRIVWLWNHAQPSAFTLSDLIETIKVKIIGFLFNHFEHTHELCTTYHLFCLNHFCQPLLLIKFVYYLISIIIILVMYRTPSISRRWGVWQQHTSYPARTLRNL